MRLSILHTSRGRVEAPAAVFATRMARRVTGYEIEYVFCTDEDDAVAPATQRLMEIAYAEVPRDRPLFMPVCRAAHVGGTPESPGRCGFRLSHVAGVNRAYLESTGNILLVGDDDVDFPPGWDKLVVDALLTATDYDLSRCAVLGIGDPHWGGPYQGDGLLCSFILTRAYAEMQGGYILWPGYDGMMCDVEFTQSAALRDVLVDAYETIHFSHHWKGNPADAQRGADWWDETHQRHMAYDCHEIGKRVYAQRLAAGFPDMLWDAATRRWHENLVPPRPPIAAMVEKYHRKACGGRFNFHAGLELLGQPVTGE